MCLSHLIYTVAVSDSHLPCHAHALLRPCRSSQGHGTERPSRDGLWATGPRSASSGYHAEFHEGCYQKHTNLRCRWPVWNQTTFVMDKQKSGSSTLQKSSSVNCWTSSSYISGYHADFHEGHGTVGAGQGAAWHVWINEGHGRGKAWERHGRGMLCVNRPLVGRHAYSNVTQSEVGLTADVVTRTFLTQRFFRGHTADMSVWSTQQRSRLKHSHHPAYQLPLQAPQILTNTPTFWWWINGDMVS